ncbi:MAG: glucose-1-phosphate adenylyltransferase [Omnitrophica bacterium RBG_13_46_9]|nr:MAG: glucose-1-phosphate adenylyltransferase [Omnitrophica bacterium RBG_13_46_9]
MEDVLCVIMGGGRGTRLYPLTKERCKPAVPLAGKFRLIDIPISNCLNSGFNKIYILTQFMSESLNKHITRTYKLDAFSKGFVEVMAAEQTMDTAQWFQGTADAVRRCLKHFNNPAFKHIIVLSGDQLYKMNLKEMFDFHKEKKADITLACNPTYDRKSLDDVGVIKLENNRIIGFFEKPKDSRLLKDASLTLDGKEAFLISMGIYIFNKDVLVELLTESDKVDFGKEIIPDSFAHKVTEAFIYKGYWRDIGSIKNFYDENLLLTGPVPPINFFDEYWQIFTRPRYLPPSKVKDGRIINAIISEGCIIESASIKHSVVGLRSRIGEGSLVEDSVIMGCDFYQYQDDILSDSTKGNPIMGVGRNCVIKKAILDKNVRIGNGVKIINDKNVANLEEENYSIKDGIVIVHKNSTIAPGTVI